MVVVYPSSCSRRRFIPPKSLFRDMNDNDDDVGMAVLVEAEYTPFIILVVVLSVIMMAMITSRRCDTLFNVLLLLLLGRDNAIIFRRNVVLDLC